MPLRRNDARISPTAHFTGHVWYRHGLGDPALRTAPGRLMVSALAPIDRLWRLRGAPTLEDVLIGRHLAIDALLEGDIERGEVGQVLEVAAGLSPRGLRLTRRHRDLVYLEGDLPGMARRKRQALTRASPPPSIHHRVVELDALRDSGPSSLEALASELDPTVSLAIVTEGLLNYFERSAVEEMWQRFATVLARHPHGLYLSDLHTRDDLAGVRGARALTAAIGAFTRGRVHLHYQGEAEIHRALEAAGFARAHIHPIPRRHGVGYAPVHVVEARAAQAG